VFSDEALPAGVTFGRKVATTVEILKVADQGGRATFLSKDGAVHKLKVAAQAKRTTLARLRPGDNVAASCTEKLSINLER
jgi:exosome complex RNA-binding protein Csl4